MQDRKIANGLYVESSEAPAAQTEQQQPFNSGGFEQQERQSYGVDILSLVNSGFMSASAGSELVTKVANGLTEVYTKTKTNNFVKVTEIDNATLPGYKYSAVVVSSLVDTTVNYFIVLLAGTGKGSITANEYFKTITTASELSGNKAEEIVRELYFPALAFSSDFKDVIERKLSESYGSNAKKYISIDGIVIHEDARVDSDEFMRKIAGKAFNANYAEFKYKDGIGFGDVNSLARKTNWRIQSNGCRNVLSNISLAGNPVRSDFQLGLSPLPSGTALNNTIHSTSNEGPILTVGGFVDAIPVNATVNENGIMKQAVRFSPQIVITNIGTNFETPGMALLAISTAVAMAKPEMYLAALSPRGRVNVGALNIIANLSDEPKAGTYLDFLSTQYGPAEIQDITMKMFSQHPSVALDIEPYGPDAYILAPFAQASDIRISQSERESALVNIVKTLSKMTNGKFDTNYPIDRIIAMVNLVPTGSYIAPGTNQVSDIRDFDMAAVVNAAGGNVEMISKWISTYSDTIPQRSFSNKIQVIAGIDGSAKVTGEVRRIVFTGEFIDRLTRAISESGLNPQGTPEVDIRVGNQFFISGYDNTGITSGFGTFGMRGNGWNQAGFNISSFGGRF